MSDDPPVPADIIESVDVPPEKTVTLRARDGTFKTFRARARGDELVGSSVGRFIEKTQQQLDWFNKSSALAAANLPAIDFVGLDSALEHIRLLEREAIFPKLARPDETLATFIAKLGLDTRQTLESAIAEMRTEWARPLSIEMPAAQLALDGVRQWQFEVADAIGSVAETIKAENALIATNLIHGFEAAAGNIASEFMRSYVFDGVDLLADALARQVIRTDVSEWIGASGALADMTRAIDASFQAAFPAELLERIRAWEERETERRRLRVGGWMEELGSTDDPQTVELIEVDGADIADKWEAYWVSYLGVRTDSKPKPKDKHVVEIDGVAMWVWGIRINCSDTQPYLEVRNPPWGNGQPNLVNLDTFRPAENTRMLSALQLLGYRRRRGRKSLAELWDADEFHASYRAAEARAGARRAGKRPRQIDIAEEMSMGERQLRRYLAVFGKPSEKRS